MAFCTICGQPIPEDLGYCPNCVRPEADVEEKWKASLIRSILIGVIIILVAAVINLCIIKGIFGSGTDGFDYEKQPVEVTTTTTQSG